MSYRDIWPTRAEIEEIDAENAARMVLLNTKDLGTPYCPVGPSEPVKRGGMGEGDREFILAAEEACRRLT